MDSTFLVDMDIRAVPMLISEFKRLALDLRLLMVAQLQEYAEPRLILASPSFDNFSPLANYLKFGEIIKAMEQREDEVPESPDPLILKTEDPFISDLRTRFGDVKSKFGKRIRSARLGRRFVEDGYLFLLSKN